MISPFVFHLQDQHIGMRYFEVQFWTAKVDKLASFGTGFFWDKWTSDLNSEGLKTSKNALFGTFPWVFGRGQFFLIFLVPFSGDLNLNLIKYSCYRHHCL
jgi:hypothetical protein